jgi:hypothetical protein
MRLLLRGSFDMVRATIGRSRMAAHSAKPEDLAVKSTGRKLSSERLLGQAPVTVSDGREYGLEEKLRPSVTLSQARAAWKPLVTSLAAAVIVEREQS